MRTSRHATDDGSTRRRFLKTSAAAGAATGLLGASVGASPAQAQALPQKATPGDVDILKFLAAAELVEDDLWQQYCELAVGNPGFSRRLQRIDPSLVRYICDDRDDERSHHRLINAYLESIGETPVNLDPFRTLPSSNARGAESTGRLTNLTNLTVDTSWYNRYRSAGNPHFGDSFPQVVEIKDKPAIPTDNGFSNARNQSIAHVAAFHFGTIEQGGASLYTALLAKVTSLDALIILSSIGPTEFYHFAAFHKSLEGLFGFDGFGLSFPDLKRDKDRSRAIFPEPAKFLGAALGADLPLVSVVRPRSIPNAGAVASATSLVSSGLFEGQPQAFLDAVTALATAADAAQRGDGGGG